MRIYEERWKPGWTIFLGKPFDELELKARRLVGKRIVALQKELINAREGMRTAATYDGRTWLLNRREIVACLSRARPHVWGSSLRPGRLVWRRRVSACTAEL